MKVLTLALLLASSMAHATTYELACWNMYSKKGSAPILTAEIDAGASTLNQVKLNTADAYFEGYTFNEEKYTDYVETSSIKSDLGSITGSLITTKRSPYVGDVEYITAMGEHAWGKKGEEAKSEEYPFRLILPADVSPEALKAFRIRQQDERSNAVVVLRPPSNTDQGGDSFLRMFCVTK